MQLRKFEYGYGNAIMVLVAEQLGLSPVLVGEAQWTLEGKPIHPMTGAALEKEAVRVNELVRKKGSDALAQANAHAEALKVRYGFVPPADLVAESSKPVRRMYCTCCGGIYQGRQWYNQDTGHGLGDCCVEYVKSRYIDVGTQTFDQCYGFKGVHYNIAKSA